MKTEEYFENIAEETEKAYKVAREARNQSKDPEQRVDIPVATDLPEKGLKPGNSRTVPGT